MGGNTEDVMEKGYRYLAYYTMVVQRGWSDTVQHYQEDKKNLLGNVVTGIISAAVSPFLLYRFGGVNAMSDIKLVFTVVFLSAIAGALGWYLILLAWNIFAAHTKLFREKEDEANKLTWKDIEILPYNFPEGSGLGVGLEIISDKPKMPYSGKYEHAGEYDITRVIPKVVEVFYAGKNEKTEFTLPLYNIGLADNRRVDFILNRRQLRNEITFAIAMSIVNWNEDSAWLTIIEDNTSYKLDEDVEYKLKISIERATMDINTMILEPCFMICDLKYHKSKDGEKKVSLKMSYRTPKYRK